MELRAIHNAVDFIARNSLCANDITIAKECYILLAYIDYTMHDKGVTVISHYHIVFANILLAYRSERDCRTATKEWQHTLSSDR